MGDRKKVVEFAGLDPGKPFYMAAACDLADGSMDPDQMPEGFFTEPEGAIATLVDYADEHNGNGYVYLCTPIKRIKRGRVQVSDIGKKR